jgi:hypothetical protein
MRQKENIEQRISNAEAEKQTKNFIIRNSLFDIRYSLRAHGKFMIHELPTGEGLAKQLLFFGNASSVCFITLLLYWN